MTQSLEVSGSQGSAEPNPTGITTNAQLMFVSLRLQEEVGVSGETEPMCTGRS